MQAHTEEILEFGKIRAAVAENAVCPLGSERVMTRPVATQPDEIEREYTYIAELYRLFDRNQEPPIQGLQDLRALWRQVAPRNAVLEPTALVQVADLCSVVARIRKFFTQKRDDAPQLAAQADLLTLLHEVEYHIRQAIESNGEVLDRASPRLREIRGEIRSLEGRIQHVLERLVRSLLEADVLQDDFITQRQGRYVLPVKAGQKGRIRGIVHDASHTGETFFIEPFDVVEMTNDLTERRVEEREEIRKILTALCDLVRGNLAAFEQNTALLTEMDERVARARFGWNRRWILPSWHAQRPLRIIGAHHPLLLLKSPDRSVPLDLPLGGGDHVLIVSGPNAGGKTTALKTVGLLTLMFQSSMPVPADPASTFRIFENIVADIGDEQDVTAGISTFSSHMRHIADMLKVANETTLVLLDELGTATDPTEGGALAVAIVESLLDRGSLVLVTSHMARLKSWAEQHPHARNASFHLDPRTQRPTYRLRLDVPGVSEALVIAEQQGLDPRVVERAYRLLPEGVYDLNQVLLRLQEREKELADQLAEAARRERDAAARQSELDSEREELQQQRRHLKREFLQEKETWLRDVRQKIEKQIAQLASREDVLKVKREIQALQDSVRSEQDSLERDVPVAASVWERLQPGRRVRVEFLHDDGEIVAVTPERQHVTVLIRNVEVELSPDQIVLLDEKPEPPQAIRRVGVRRDEAISSTLELHGLRAEEAVARADRFIDLALRHDMAQVRIRHGRGTGALRRAIHEFLRDHRSVRSFALADEQNGGDGVTIVELK